MSDDFPVSHARESKAVMNSDFLNKINSQLRDETVAILADAVYATTVNEALLAREVQQKRALIREAIAAIEAALPVMDDGNAVLDARDDLAEILAKLRRTAS